MLATYHVYGAKPCILSPRKCIESPSLYRILLHQHFLVIPSDTKVMSGIYLGNTNFGVSATHLSIIPTNIHPVLVSHTKYGFPKAKRPLYASAS